VDCVIASVDGTAPGRLAIADIVADHRRVPAATAAQRAAFVFSYLPGCTVFLTAEVSGNYLAFLRDGRCVPVRAVPGCDHAPSAVAEACALLLYTRVCAGQMPSAVTVMVAPRRRPASLITTIPPDQPG
jgi:hypothetical protein